MKQLAILMVALFVLVFNLPGNADEASNAFKQGTRAEANNQYDQAFDAYSQAHKLKPKDPKYFAAYVRMRFYVAVDDVHAGQQLRDAGKLQEALLKIGR